jgi:thermostable 8-oxoguanine DNA glycosylase
VEKKYIVCLSGGHSSAIAAIETVRKYGKENVILLNHDISPDVEDQDIKRFKNEISEYLEIPITYANMEGWETKTPLKVCREIKGFKFGLGTALCTYNLKTKPFYKYLNDNYPVEKGQMREDVKIIYGFDREEPSRIQRRIGVMQIKGYYTDFPLAYWDRTIQNTEEIGIKRPSTYKLFRHANCIGCLKAGKQQWYLVYCLYPQIWSEALQAENEIGYSILKDTYLEELESKFRQMKCKGITPGEKMKPQTFWAEVEKALPMDGQLSFLPCECAL